tara:strand:- start:337 stop:537 length:201 start_codon:yes stop_codon:yes gene_type:complete
MNCSKSSASEVGDLEGKLYVAFNSFLPTVLVSEINEIYRKKSRTRTRKRKKGRRKRRKIRCAAACT